MDLTQEKVFRLAKRLFAMSMSNSIYEARIAKLKLEQLLSRYKIDIEELQPTINEVVWVSDRGKPIVVYKEYLYVHTIGVFGGESIVSPQYDHLNISYESTELKIEKSLNTIKYFSSIIENEVNSIDINNEFKPSFKYGMAQRFIKHLSGIEEQKKHKSRVTTEEIIGLLSYNKDMIPFGNDDNHTSDDIENLPDVVEKPKREVKDLRPKKEETTSYKQQKQQKQHSEEDVRMMNEIMKLKREFIVTEYVIKGDQYAQEMEKRVHLI